jgi:hypothetical protein
MRSNHLIAGVSGSSIAEIDPRSGVDERPLHVDREENQASGIDGSGSESGAPFGR